MNSAMRDISVVMPLYNKEGEVGRAVRSVLAQTVPNFELIVVNDGSTDTGSEVVRSIRDPRVRVVDQDNKGVSLARNRGIAEAATELIAFIDADDEWNPDFLETIFRLRDNFPSCDVFATSYYYSTSDSNMRPIFFSGMPEKAWEGIVDFDFSIIPEFDPPISSSAVAVTKRAITSVGGFPAGVSVGEDLLTWVKLRLNYGIAYSARPCSIYRAPSTFRPDRVPQYPDIVGLELERLARNADIFKMRELRETTAYWYRRRGIMNVFLREREKALEDIRKAINILGLNGDLCLLAAIARLPVGISTWSLSLLRQVKALRRKYKNQISKIKM